jgi:hypothetical protein
MTVATKANTNTEADHAIAMAMTVATKANANTEADQAVSGP